LGRAETLWAALYLAISPAMVFYSRYYIHEMLLVFFTAVLVVVIAFGVVGLLKPSLLDSILRHPHTQAGRF
jgi:predicted membrane-bound mannosyltransferase